MNFPLLHVLLGVPDQTTNVHHKGGCGLHDPSYGCCDYEIQLESEGTQRLNLIPFGVNNKVG